MKTVLITGSSSGIGKDTCIYFQKKGWNVAATMRATSRNEAIKKELSQLDNVKVFALDVTDKKSIDAAVKKTIDSFGDLHVLVNNAGYGLAGAMELATTKQIERQYETNLYGPIYVMQAVLPHFRAKKDGLIINVTSVGGRTTFPFNSLYHGTKYALEGISESINFELQGLGITVKLVEPGGVKTDFASRSLDVTQSDTVKDYDDIFQRAVAIFSDPKRSSSYSTGQDIAKVIFQASTDGKDRIRYIAGKDAKMILGLRKFMSDRRYLKTVLKRFNVG